MKIRIILSVVLMLMTVNLVGGSKVKFLKTWKNPEAQAGSWKGKKVVALVRTLAPDTREGAEQALARELTKRGAVGVPGSSVIPASARQDPATVKRLLQEAGFSGAVVMTVVEFKPEVVGSPGQHYAVGPTITPSGFSDYYALYGFHGSVTPATISAKVNLVVETLVFSIDQDKLAWSGTSSNTNAKEADEVIAKMVEMVGKEVQKAGLVAK